MAKIRINDDGSVTKEGEGELEVLEFVEPTPVAGKSRDDYVASVSYLIWSWLEKAGLDQDVDDEAFDELVDICCYLASSAVISALKDGWAKDFGFGWRSIEGKYHITEAKIRQVLLDGKARAMMEGRAKEDGEGNINL